MALKRTRNILITTAVAAAVVGLGASLAFAATGGPAPHAGLAGTWTVSPGGSATGASGTVSITDTVTGTAITCTSSTGAGTLKKGSGLSGAKIGEVAKPPIFNHCGWDGLIWDWFWPRGPWWLYAVSYNSAKGVTTGEVKGLHAMGTSTGCSLVLDGSSATSNNGEVRGTYTSSTGRGTLLSSGGDLHFWGVSGCVGAFNNGDAAIVRGSFTVSPKQTVTSP